MKALPSCEDYITSIGVPKLIKATELYGGKVVSFNGNPIMYAGGFCVVFPFMLSSSKKVAVRCWTAFVPDAEKRCVKIASELKRSGLPYFVEFDYIPQGIATSDGVFPIVVMDWVDAIPLKEYISKHIFDTNRISSLAENFKKMVSDLHKVSFSHGDLQHGNIMVTNGGRLILVDYDSMFVPGLENVSDEIKGLAGYQHPGRTKLKNLSPKTDYFSELIIYTSLVALTKFPQLWHQLNIEDTETLLFTQEDLDSPHRSGIFKELNSDDDLKPLIEAIKKALNQVSIDSLLPLEEAIIPDSIKIVKGLQDKWNNPPDSIKEEQPIDLGSMPDKWRNRKSQSQMAKNIDVCSITSKWEK